MGKKPISISQTDILKIRKKNVDGNHFGYNEKCNSKNSCKRYFLKSIHFAVIFIFLGLITKITFFFLRNRPHSKLQVVSTMDINFKINCS